MDLAGSSEEEAPPSVSKVAVFRGFLLCWQQHTYLVPGYYQLHL